MTSCHTEERNGKEWNQMEYCGILWKVLECSGTFLSKLVYIDLNHRPKGRTGTSWWKTSHQIPHPTLRLSILLLSSSVPLLHIYLLPSRTVWLGDFE
jgi:hypothetical protein